MTGRLLRLCLAVLPLAACDCDEGLLNVSARLSVEPRDVDFGKVPVGGLRVKGLALTNEGSALLRITKFELLSNGQEIAFASPVPETVPPGAPLMFNLAYEPTDVGEDTAVLLIEADDGEGEHRIELRGEGVIGGVAVSHEGDACPGQENSIDFGQIEPGSTVTRMLTVRSVGGESITVLSAVTEPGTTAEFEIDDLAEPVTLAPDESVQIEARYTPTDGGPDSGAFVITTDLESMPSLRIPVCGAGIAPALCGAPVPLDLGLVGVGTTAMGTLTLESCGLLPVELTSVTISGDADITLQTVPSTPVTLDPGETTDVVVSLTSSTLGAKNAQIEVTSNVPTAQFPVVAQVARPCDLQIAPTQLVYAGVDVGNTDVRTVLVANAGASDCTLTRIEVTSGAEFSVASAPTLPFTLGSGGAELLTVQYAPTSTGTAMGILEIDGGGVQQVDLLGNPNLEDECAVQVTPSVVQFGSQPVGSISMRGTRVEAIGGDPCRIRDVRMVRGVPDFTVMPPLGGIVLPNFGTDVLVTYRPTSSGNHFDIMEIEVGPFGGGATTVHQVGVVAASTDARLCAMPMMIDFGTVAAGTVQSRTVDISSCGAADLELRGVLRAPGTSSTFQLSMAPTVPQTIPAGSLATPTLTVDYMPVGNGPHFGQIDLISSDSMNPVVSIPITGNWGGGCPRILDCSPTTIDFGPTDVGITKVRSVACRNAGPDPLTINSVALAGASSMTLVASTPTTLQPGDTWSAEVRFAPIAPQNATAMLTIASDACQAPGVISVAGVGQPVIRPDCIPPATFSPQIEWSWTGSTIEPTFDNVWMTPMVANLTDDNNDGRVDENDIPDVIFTSFDQIPISDPTTSRPGVLRVLSGDTGAEHFSVTDVRLAESAQIAIGDIDGDGFPEIIGSMWVQTPPGTGTGGFNNRYATGNLVALDRFGNVLWVSDPWTWPSFVLWNASAPYLVDLDGDGFSEIILGNEVFDHRGRRLWSGTGSRGLAAGGGPHAIAADIDLDGTPEVIAGDTAYRADGTILWQAQVNNRNIGEGGTSVGMLDPNDPYPQIALDTVGGLYVIDRNGQVQWSVGFTDREPTATLPVIADFDGDGDADVAVADGELMRAYTGTGTPLFMGAVMDTTCCAGITGFDFEGDGGYELLLHDFGNIYAYRGTTGAQIYSASRANPTNLEIPVVADIDNDRRAEVVVALYDDFGNAGGVIAYSNIGNSWVAAPRIWNQQAYHVTNVTEAGAIPRTTTPIPQAPPVFRATIADCVP